MTEEKYLVRVHRHYLTERNPFVVCLIYLVEGEAGAWARVMNHQGIDSNILAVREMTEREKGHYLKCWRMFNRRYKTWEGLINDEYVETMNKEYCMNLYQLSGLTKSFEEIIFRKEHVQIIFTQPSLFDNQETA